MASRNQPNLSSQGLVPDKLEYTCGHTAPGTEESLQKLFQWLVAYDVVQHPEKVTSSTAYCSDCLNKAFEKAGEEPGSKDLWEKWCQMALRPGTKPASDQNVNRVSSMLMYTYMWFMLNDPHMRKYLYTSYDPMAHAVFDTFRQICWDLGKGLTHEDLLQLSHAIGGMFYPHVASDLWDIMELYRFKPADIESMMPGDPGLRDNVHRECVRRFHERAGAPDLVYPVDISQEYHLVIRSSSRWSAEFLAPPQKIDTNENLLTNMTWGPVEYAKLCRAIDDLNDEGMRFKLQLFRMFKYFDTARQIPDASGMKKLQETVRDLEKGAKLVLPHEARKRQAWRGYVDFAKPYLARPPQEPAQQPMQAPLERPSSQEYSFGPAEEEAYSRMNRPFGKAFYELPEDRKKARLSQPFSPDFPEPDDELTHARLDRPFEEEHF
ncbi:hypothetical protein PG987_005926 [Apiospora arundinis]